MLGQETCSQVLQHQWGEEGLERGFETHFKSCVLARGQ